MIATKLGTPCATVACVGNDEKGDFIIDAYQRMGIDYSMIQRSKCGSLTPLDVAMVIAVDSLPGWLWATILSKPVGWAPPHLGLSPPRWGRMPE